MKRTRLISVNVGRAEPMPVKSGQSGINKRPVVGAVEIGLLGIASDAIVDRDNHGGPEQAVYLYFATDYDWWAERLARPMPPGMLGENLTISGVAGTDVHVGDRFTFGDCCLEVTSPRIPCVTLAHRMDDPGFVRLFHKSGRPGAYARVVKPGQVSAGIDGAWHPFDGPKVGLAELMRDGSSHKLDEQTVARWRQAPIHKKLRENLSLAYPEAI